MTGAAAAILVGGLGTRLGHLVSECPKPMLDVGGRPFLEYLLLLLARQGIRSVLLLCGYRAEVVARHFAGRSFGPLTVECLVEKRPLGTAGALAAALDHLDDEFYLLNGDSYFAADLAALSNWLGDGWDGALTLARMADVGRYGTVDMDVGGRVEAFREKGISGPGLINAGIYRLRKKALARFAGAVSLEREILPVLAAEGRLRAVLGDGPFIDIGVPEDLTRARTEHERLFQAVTGTVL